uniref:Uncharacterized protein n=1 Tax=Anguilla anguilla TaxID=7936 RepID=A0A0E9PUD2_ANGAN
MTPLTSLHQSSANDTSILTDFEQFQ